MARHEKSLLIFHNAPFDLGVIEKETRHDFDSLLQNGRIHDTGLLWQLYHLAKEGHVPRSWSLDFLAKEILGIELEKNEDIRLNFSQFKGKDYEDINRDFLVYALYDAIVTFDLHTQLIRRIKDIIQDDKRLLTHKIQLMGAIALKEIEKNGIRFDLKSKNEFLASLDPKFEKQKEILESYGLVRGQKGYQKRYQEVIESLALELPKTSTGKISSKREDLEKFRGNEFVDALLGFKDLEKTRNFVLKLKDPHLHPWYRTMVNTGRTSCSSPNVQQLPRKEGIRELFIPREGHVFLIIDYSQLELCTLAQTTYSLYGHSRMRELINDGVDLHRYFASKLLNKPIEEITKKERQSAKAVNFGFPGGLGLRTFKIYAKSTYGVDFNESEAREARNLWKKIFPEMQLYLKGEDYQDAWTITGRIRGKTRYTASKNTPFQGLAADGAKVALYRLGRAGHRIVAFIHDEVIIEVPKDDDLDSSFKNACKIMVDSMGEVCPDVKIKVEGFITDRWRKEA